MADTERGERTKSPRIFIGTSLEGQYIAPYLRRWLKIDGYYMPAEPILPLKKKSYTGLFRSQFDSADVAIFAISDREASTRAKSREDMRDAVIFAAGSYGSLPGPRCAIVISPRDEPWFKIPRRFEGVHSITYEAAHLRLTTDALSDACHRIRKIIGAFVELQNPRWG